MAIGVKDRILFQITIGGKEINFDQNKLDFFHLVESVRLSVPAMTIQIQDITRFFSKNDLLVDGAPIQVTLGVDSKKLIFPMRYFTHKESLSSGSPTFRIYAYLDVPVYWTGSLSSTFTGTASGVLRSLCADCDLTYDGVDTNDSQLWIPHNRKYKEFAKYIAGRAFVDESSCNQMYVGTNKKMVMRNVSNFEKQPTIQTFANMPGTGQATISDHRVVNKSGFFNSISGYKDQQVNQSNLKEDETIKDTKVSKNTSKLMMSEEIRNKVTQNRVMHGPIDVGNVNENYERGRYQNARLGNLFNSGLELVTPSLCNAELLDVVGAQVSRPGADNIANISGRYMLTSKVFYMSNNNFVQKLEMFRHGLNDKRESTQA
jgi:hypothetical protein